jgi:hypothetical protein
MNTVDPDTAPAAPDQRWLTPGVAGIGTASFLADVGHEVLTAALGASGQNRHRGDPTTCRRRGSSVVAPPGVLPPPGVSPPGLRSSS